MHELLRIEVFVALDFLGTSAAVVSAWMSAGLEGREMAVRHLDGVEADDLIHYGTFLSHNNPIYNLGNAPNARHLIVYHAIEIFD